MLPRWRLVGGASQPEVVAFDSISVDFVAVLNKMYRFFFSFAFRHTCIVDFFFIGGKLPKLNVWFFLVDPASSLVLCSISN